MLDARVFCNCVETGTLRVKPKPHWQTTILEDGDIEVDCADEREATELRRWWKRACEHEDRQLLYHCIGNIAMVAFLRDELGRVAEKCPIILGRIVYDGIHGGDFLTVEQVRVMEQELRALDGFRCKQDVDQPHMDRFIEQMRELVAASLLVQKPIVF